MSNKDAVGQEIILFEPIGRVSRLLDQFSCGLESTGLLNMMRTFPDLFVHLFTYTACVSSTAVLESIYADEEESDDYSGNDLEIIMNHLTKFINDATE